MAKHMKHVRWLSFLVLLGIQGIFSGPGGSAEPSRTLAVGSAQEKGGRVAIVIGNSNYPSGALTNPKNDATAMAASLKKLGFDVELKLDATKADIDGILRRFSGKAEKATVAALFYAGHGIQVNGSNYLVPIDANPRNERDLKRDMVKMDDVIDDMGDARVKLVFFDACRDNPLSRSFSRGGSRGMAAPVEATGTLISFATKHGNTAADGDSNHSPYTSALLAALENPSGVEIEQLLRRVQQGVKAETKGQQEPWRYGSLDGDFYFKAADPADNAKVQQEAVEKAVLEAMRRSNEQAAREKAELQQSIKAQQEASERAAREAAARERAELQKTLKAQQEASERAMAEALRKANEQAAKERAEMQASMDKMLKEALAKQNAALEAERAARLAAAAVGGVPASASAQAPSMVQAAKPVAEKPIQLASIAPTTSAGAGSKPSEQVLASLSSAPGDEWEYVARDEMFGKTQKLVLRVKAATSEGVLEEIVWNGRSGVSWVFGPRAAALGTPNESEFMFAPHWNGDEVSDLVVEGGGSMCTSPGASCKLSLKVAGTEKLKIPAGTFDAVRLEGSITASIYNGSVSGPVTIWYSKEQRRLLKQSAELRGNRFKFKETLELSAVRLVRDTASQLPRNISQVQPPIKLAAVGATTDLGGQEPSPQGLKSLPAAPGDEWKYVLRDTFGKKQVMVGRVKEIVAGGSVLEEYMVDGRSLGEWMFDGKAALFGLPIDAGLLVAPYWSGDPPHSLTVMDGSALRLFGAMAKSAGNERIKVPAGSFDTLKIRINVAAMVQNSSLAGTLEILAWYSIDQKRLVRQTVKGRHPYPPSPLNTIDETIELSAYHSGAKQ